MFVRCAIAAHRCGKKPQRPTALSAPPLLHFAHASMAAFTMIIACPACTTKYVVPDTAIGVEGRTVRCAKCRHSWHQDGPPMTARDAGRDHAPTPVAPPPRQAAAPETESVRREAPKPGFSEPHRSAAESDTQTGTQAEPQTEPQAEPQDEPPFAPTAPPASAAPLPRHYDDDDDGYDDAPSPFERQPPFRPRRNPLKVWTAAGAIFAALAVGAVFAVSYYGFPDWMPISRPTFAVAQPDLLLDFPADQQDRRTLPDGSEFFSASGTITNSGRETRTVPSILIVMRNEREVPVYSWVLAPPEKQAGARRIRHYQRDRDRRPTKREICRDRVEPRLMPFHHIGRPCICRLRHLMGGASGRQPTERAPRCTCGITCGRGGTGRRATLRSLWANARGSSRSSRPHHTVLVSLPVSGSVDKLSRGMAPVPCHSFRPWTPFAVGDGSHQWFSDAGKGACLRRQEFRLQLNALLRRGRACCAG